MDETRKSGDVVSEERDVPTVNTSELLSFMMARAWIVLLWMAAMTGVMAAISAMTVEQYRSETLVRLAKSSDQDAGVAGMVVEKVRRESELKEGILLSLRTPERVVVIAEAAGREQAMKLSELAANHLVQASNLALENALSMKRELIQNLKVQIKHLDSALSVSPASMSRRSRDEVVSAWFNESLHMDSLMSQRRELRGELIRIEMDILNNTSRAMVVEGPLLPKKPFRPNWQRNLSIGALFGFLLGLTIVLILGVLKQLGCRGDLGASTIAVNPRQVS